VVLRVVVSKLIGWLGWWDAMSFFICCSGISLSSVSKQSV